MSPGSPGDRAAATAAAMEAGAGLPTNPYAAAVAALPVPSLLRPHTLKHLKHTHDRSGEGGEGKGKEEKGGEGGGKGGEGEGGSRD